MEVKVTLKLRNGKAFAEAIYRRDIIVVLPGGYINLTFADHICGGNLAKAYREDNMYVDEDGKILKNCEFTSPSTAAQFVTGRSINGYYAWKVAPKKSLGKYLKEKGLR